MELIDLRCPNCNRFLAQVLDFGRTVCPNCGGETTFKSREHRKKETPRIERAVLLDTGAHAMLASPVTTT